MDTSTTGKPKPLIPPKPDLSKIALEKKRKVFKTTSLGEGVGKLHRQMLCLQTSVVQQKPNSVSGSLELNNANLPEGTTLPKCNELHEEHQDINGNIEAQFAPQAKPRSKSEQHSSATRKQKITYMRRLSFNLNSKKSLQKSKRNSWLHYHKQKLSVDKSDDDNCDGDVTPSQRECPPCCPCICHLRKQINAQTPEGQAGEVRAEETESQGLAATSETIYPAAPLNSANLHANRGTNVNKLSPGSDNEVSGLQVRTKLSDAPSSSIPQEPETEHYEKDLSRLHHSSFSVTVRDLITPTSSSRNSPLNVHNTQQSNMANDAKPKETEAKIKYGPSSDSCSHSLKDEDFSGYSKLELITATESDTEAKRQGPALLPQNQLKSGHLSHRCLPSKPENTQLMNSFAGNTTDPSGGEREYMDINDNDVIYGHKLDTVPSAPKLPLPPLPSRPPTPCCKDENRNNRSLEYSLDNRQASLTIREKNWTSRFANEPFYQAYNQASILKELKHQLSSRFMSQDSKADPDSPNHAVVVRLPSQQKKKSDGHPALQADDIRTRSPLSSPVKNKAKVKHKISSGSTTSQADEVTKHRDQPEQSAPSSRVGSLPDVRVERHSLNEGKEARGEQGSSGSVGLPTEDVTKNSMFSCWQEMPGVKASGALAALTRGEILLQESMFEVVTSEASYLRSLNVTIDHFMASEELNRLLTKQDKKILFSTIIKIQQVSENFLIDLECRLDENPVISDISDITEHHAIHSFSSYIDYVRNQPYQEKIFHQFTKAKAQFTKVINRLQDDPICHRLPLKSFLVLPFQRITRLKILIENILKRTERGSNREKMAAAALKEVSKIVGECNKEVGKMKQTEEMVHIGNTIEFTKMKAIPVISQFRWLVKRGELLELSMQEKFFRLKKLSPIYLFLFNDLLLVTVRKGADRFVVQDYSHRSLTQVQEVKLNSIGSLQENSFVLVLVQNRSNECSKRLVKASNPTEKARWMEALTQKKSSENDNEESEYEKVYEDWDCPQVQCLEAYVAQQADELNLDPANLINVTHKTTDGWCKGIRLSDGKMGWFPSSCVKEIKNEHVRRRNLLERYRVLQAAEELVQLKS